MSTDLFIVPMKFKKFCPVMLITKTPSKMFSITNCAFSKDTTPTFGNTSIVMETTMQRIIGKLKIFWTVIQSVFVNMVNYLRRVKVSSQIFFHIKAMFSNITKFIGKWMIWVKNKLISTSYKPTSFIAIGIFTFGEIFKITLSAISCFTISFHNCFTSKVSDRTTINTFTNYHILDIVV